MIGQTPQNSGDWNDDSAGTVNLALCANERAEPPDADIEMTRRIAFPAILRLRDRSCTNPIE